jgi:hypothetical protein
LFHSYEADFHVRCRQWSEATDIPLPDLSAKAKPDAYLLCAVRETTRDHNRRILPLIMAKKYGMLNFTMSPLTPSHPPLEAAGIPPNDKVNFSWLHTLDIMWQNQISVHHWPAKVVPLRPGFSTNGRDITSEMLDAICLPLLKARMHKDNFHSESMHVLRKASAKGNAKVKGKGKEKEKDGSLDIPIPDKEFEIVPWPEGKSFLDVGIYAYFNHS